MHQIKFKSPIHIKTVIEKYTDEIGNLKSIIHLLNIPDTYGNFKSVKGIGVINWNKPIVKFIFRL